MPAAGPQDRRVTVIGAGIVGMACASYLQRDGREVTVIDRVPPGEGCSRGNAGGLSPGSIVPLSMPGVLPQIPGWLLDPLGPLTLRWRYLPWALPWLLRFVRAGTPRRVEEIATALRALHEHTFECYDPLVKACGAEHLIQRAGQLYVYQSQSSFDADARGRALRRAHGVEVVDLDANGIRELEPALAPIFKRGAHMPDHGHCSDPFRLVQCLAEHFVRSGGEVLQRDVTGIDLGPDGPRRLRTDAGDIDVDRLVVAAGAWSHLLARRLGSKVPLETQRGYHVTVANAGITPRLNVMWAERKFMATPMVPGLRFAGTVEFAGLDAPPDYRRARALLAHGTEMYPGIDARDVSEWMGHRPSLPDTIPVIGRSPHFKTVFYAFGHGHTGLSGASMTGRVIADLVAGREPPIAVAPFRVDRF